MRTILEFFNKTIGTTTITIWQMIIFTAISILFLIASVKLRKFANSVKYERKAEFISGLVYFILKLISVGLFLIGSGTILSFIFIIFQIIQFFQ